MKRTMIVFLTLMLLLVAIVPAQAARPVFGELFYNGEVVRTIIPPAKDPNSGRDNLYGVANGAEGQRGVAAVAPGDPGYHGGHWAFWSVTFKEGVTPYLLTSEAEVHAAYLAGDVTVTRVPEMDFRCPIQP